MRITTDVIQTLNENGIDVSSAWMWCIQDVYDQSYRQVLEQPISLESLTLDFCRWKTSIADITIRVSNDANSDVLWAGEAALIDDSAYTPDPVVNQPIIYPSTGMIGTKPTIVDNGNGTITIGAGTAILRQDTTTYSNLLQYSLAGATFTIPQDSQTYYICAKYNNGTAAYYLEVLEGNINAKTIIPVYAVWNILGILSYQYFGTNGDLLANKIDYALVDTVPYKVSIAGGLIISEANLVWSATGAIVYAGTTPIQISAITASSSNLIKAYTVSGVWNYSTGTATYDNTHYDNGSNVVALGSSKYAVRWIFRSMSSPDQLYYVMGLTQYSTAASAEDELLRTDLPELITKHTMLIGKAIVQNGASAGVTESTINTSFSGGAISSNHNSLGGIYGDSPFYHLSLGAYTQINNINNLTGTGLLKLTNNVPSLDTNSYLTGNQSINITGIVTGSGTTSIATSIADGALSIAKTSGLQAALDSKANSSLLGNYLPLAGGTLNSNATVYSSGASNGGFITQYANSSYPTDLRTSALSSGYVEFGYNGSIYTRLSFIGSDNTGYVKLYGSGNTGTLMVNKLVISGGTSSQFLMADGSLNSNTYLTSSSLTGYLTQTTFNSGNPDLAAIEALTGTSGLLKKTAANTWILDANSYWYTSNHPTTLAGYGISVSDTLFDSKYLQISSAFSSYVASFNIGSNNGTIRYIKLAQLPIPSVVGNGQANINMTVYAANDFGTNVPTVTMLSFGTRTSISLLSRTLNSSINSMTYGYVTNGNYVELWAIEGAWSGACTVEVNSCTQGSYGLLAVTTTNPGITTVTSVSMYDDRYLQGNQSITLTGAITGSGTTSIATTFTNTHLAGINQDLTTSSTVAFAQVYINPKSNGLYVFGSESNPITNVFHDNSNITTNAPTTNASIRNALQFNWYSTDWEIGNIRGGSTDTQGFGIACNAGTNLRWRVTNGTTYDYNNLVVSGNTSVGGLLYLSGDANVLNAAGNGWVNWFSRNNGNPIITAYGGFVGNLTGTASNASALGGMGSEYFVQGNGLNYGVRTYQLSTYTGGVAQNGNINQLLSSTFADGNFTDTTQMPQAAWWTFIHCKHSDPTGTGASAMWGMDIAGCMTGTEQYCIRENTGTAYGAWRTLIHSSNYPSFNNFTDGITSTVGNLTLQSDYNIAFRNSNRVIGLLSASAFNLSTSLNTNGYGIHTNNITVDTDVVIGGKLKNAIVSGSVTIDATFQGKTINCYKGTITLPATGPSDGFWCHIVFYNGSVAGPKIIIDGTTQFYFRGSSVTSTTSPCSVLAAWNADLGKWILG